MRKAKIRLWALAPVVVAVCAAGWWAGAFCGSGAAKKYASLDYESFDFFDDAKTLVRRARDFPDWEVWFESGDRRLGRRCGLSGLVAGGLWCLVMVLRGRRMVRRHGKAGPSLMVLGALVGAAVGALSSLAIHAAIQIYYRMFLWNGIAVGSLLGLTVGLVLGLPSGALFWLSAKLGTKKVKVRREYGW